MSRLARNVSANLLSNAWSTGLSLLLTPLYISLLGVESYGLIGFYVSWVAVLGILDAGISATAVRELAWLAARPAERGSMPSLLRSLEVAYWGIIVGVGLCMLGAAWWFGPAWFHSQHLPSDTVRDALMLMVLSLVVQVPSGLYVGGLMGLQRQVQCSGLIAVFGTLRGAGTIAALWLFHADIRVFFLVQLATGALQTAVMRWTLWRMVRMDEHPARFSVGMLQSVKVFAGGITLLTALSVFLTQVDKMILSRFASLEVFGFYALAWTVASGLSRVATPLIQAFGPHFTELTAQGDGKALARQFRLASQVMSALILPPAALIVFMAEPILIAWISSAAVAAGAAPLLKVMVVGTVLSACSYPALSILYSRKQLRPVIIANLVSLAVLTPLLVVAVLGLGSMGAALCWALYGLAMYVTYETIALRGLPNAGVVSSMLRDFAFPALASFAAAGIVWSWSREIHGRAGIVIVLTVGLLTCWTAATLACRELLGVALGRIKWNTRAIL